MRSRWFSMAALLLSGAVALGQQPGVQTPPSPQAQSPAFDPQNNRLDAILQRWETAMAGAASLYAQVNRTAVDNVYKTTKVYSGKAKFLKPNKASLELVEVVAKPDPKKPQDFEKIICNGNMVYSWEPSHKEIHIHEFPKSKQGPMNDDLVSMLFGTKAIDAKQRYILEELPEPADPKLKGLYFYILVNPRNADDKAQFTRARLVLTAATYMPREIYWEQPNGNTTKWDFPSIVPNSPQVTAQDFAEPKATGGWQLKRMPMQGK